MTSYKEIEAMLTAPGGGFDLDEIEVDGVPVRVYKNAPATLRDVWAAASFQGDATYLVFEDERYSYAEIDARIRSLANVLVNDCGIGPGDRVALATRNYPEWVVAYWAVVSVGAAVVAMNAWWTGPEMVYGLTDSTPKLLIADDERVERIRPHLDELRAKFPLKLMTVRFDGELPDDAHRWEDLVDPDNAGPMPEADIKPDDDATIFYTSGTTGFPKGAQLTHRSCANNIMNMAYVQFVALMMDPPPEPDPAAEAAPAEPVQVTVLAPTPLFHVTACNCAMHPLTMIGGRIVLMNRWDAGRALELIEREGVQRVVGVPVQLREMLAHPDFETRDLSTLAALSGGGAQVQPDLVRKISDRGNAGQPSTGYGLTEVSGILASVSSKAFVGKPESVGPVVPNLEAKLVDPLGNDLEPGPDTVGELCVRGSSVIKGYLNKPEATAEAIRDGWFHTGDIARIDDEGFLYIVDRAKDMVLRGGENVYCSEVESAIFEHPAVAEAVVFSVPDERLGEAVGACVVLNEGSTLDADTLQAFVAERIAKFKVPEHVWFRHEPLPRNASGKFLKRQVREELVSSA
jgi:acyl-CoA synthetase (AMP-forming)/AMP-acid ligase II